MTRLLIQIASLVLSLIYFGCSALTMDAGDRGLVLEADDTSNEESIDDEADTEAFFDTDWLGDPADIANVFSQYEDGLCLVDQDPVFELYPADTNATASPILVRNALHAGVPVDLGDVRTNEFLNYYSYDYPSAAPGEVSISAGLQREGDTNQYLLQIGVTSESQTRETRRPVNLVLSIDNSSSMSGSPIALVKDSCLAIAGSLKAGDTISIANWDTQDNLILEPYSVTDAADPEVQGACQAIDGQGAADLHLGLETAYALAEAALDPQAMNRVLVMSDGFANLTRADADMIHDHADKSNGEEIYLVGVGIAPSVNYRDLLMESLTDAGLGAHLLIDSTEEAQKVFGERFITHLEVAVHDVSVTLKLPPTLSILPAYNTVGFASEELPIEPQYLAPNDSMVFFNILESCAISELDPVAPVEITVTYFDLHRTIEKSQSFSAPFGTLLESNSPALTKGDAVVSFVQTVEDIGQGYSDQERTDSLERAQSKLDFAASALGFDSEIDELNTLLGKL